MEHKMNNIIKRIEVARNRIGSALEVLDKGNNADIKKQLDETIVLVEKIINKDSSCKEYSCKDDK